MSSVKAPIDEAFQEEMGRRYIHLFSEPRPPNEIRSSVNELVAGDHITYSTSWGTLLGRTALKNYVEITQAAFPHLSYQIDNFASHDGMIYCQWISDDSHWCQRSETPELEPSTDRKTMAVRITNDRITETWQPCDPWLPVWSDVTVTPLSRTEM